MNYGIKDSANLTVLSKPSGDVFLYTPYANTTSNEWSSEQVYATSKGSRAIRWDFNKEGTLTVALEVFDLKWLALLVGSTWTKGATSMFVREVLTVEAGNKITLPKAPKVGTLSIFKLNADNVTNDAEQEVGTPASNEDEYSITGLEVTLNSTSAPVGSKFVAYFQADTAVTAQRLSIEAAKFPQAVEIIADTMIRSKETGADEFVQIHYPNARPQSNFSISMDASSVTNLEITFDLFPDSSNSIATYTIL